MLLNVFMLHGFTYMFINGYGAGEAGLRKVQRVGLPGEQRSPQAPALPHPLERRCIRCCPTDLGGHRGAANVP